MPVRIYDISKKLGLENKEVLAKAKELGIAAARVASSSLDKITAEYLEDKLKEAHPEIATAPPSAAAPVAAPEPIQVVTQPPPAPSIQIQETVTATATAVLEPPEAPPLRPPAPAPPEPPPAPQQWTPKAAPQPTP